MSPQTVHLPDGQTFTVNPVFAGVGFKSHELNTHHNPFPIGWTCVLHTETERVDLGKSAATGERNEDIDQEAPRATKHISAYRQPTLQSDTLFISSIANPSSSEYKPAASPTRQIAMMLWTTLYWYFHQPEPSPFLNTETHKHLPDAAKPKGEWKIWIKREGVLRGRNLIPKLERMGLIASMHTAVGTNLDDSGDAWDNLFVSKQMFWQIPGRLFLFTLQPLKALSSFPTPSNSRPTSPVHGDSPLNRRSLAPLGGPPQHHLESDLPGAPIPTTMPVVPNFPVGPYFSSSHLPTYYPPPPMQYVHTHGTRHPLRPKPPRMGEVFYTRFIASVGQYLSFRVASVSPKAVPYLGPVGPNPPDQNVTGDLSGMSDTQLVQKWMGIPRVSKFWGEYKTGFLEEGLQQTHSFPVVGLWDGVPFGYFEIYWVREDLLGRSLGHEIGDWDRGVHVFVGEEWARGRVSTWMSALVHWCFCVDYRTMNVCLEPRSDNERFVQRLESAGFSRVKQITLPHKQAWLVKQARESWHGPVL